MKAIETTHNQGWHVLCTYPNFEKKVYETLLSQKIETYLPLIKVEKKWSDRKKILEKPLFPNYIFIRPNKERINYLLLSIKGVVSFIKIGSKLCIVQDNEIALIQKLISITNNVTQETRYKQGDRVQMLDGPFEGICGTIKELAGRHKLYIHLELLNQTISVEISNEHTKKIISSNK